MRDRLVGGDQAALSARYDITAQPPESAAPGHATAMLRTRGNFEWRLTVATPGTFASDHPVIGVAVREQLGLALDEARGPVDVLVIDSVEAPTPN